ncbi:WD40 repeat protein [Streptomyces sp. KhCrAH-43]|uniref:DUF11 domain-containing protein n=1 Tax=unclassified Streptomyces TaxID=2593676 RepID=UPI000360378E|nr:DUF11 domain-containing protein [Streptomyces sp. KhCrAH-43]MYS38687.1 DUF11 domain-containing protein [Streptomyces sp. SID4920]MYX66879.1 DUF11 domain-containing protein [Streptomyces sp. SID8373]RAJ68375.1 WD40 repeat protein [Streptomyces sp. KhCrAH-43]
MGGPRGPRLRRLGGAVLLLTPLLVAGSVSGPQARPAAEPAAAVSDTGRIAFAGTGHRSLGRVTSETTTEDVFGGDVPAHYDQDAFGRGRALVFTSLRDEVRPQVYLRGADGTVRKLTSGMDAAHPELSVDGRTVVFDSPGNGGRRDLWSVGLDGSPARQLTDTPAEETSPTLSPDGTRIAYASDGGPEPGTQVYERALDGGPVTCLSDSAEGDADEPEWNPVGDAVHRSRVSYTLHVEPASDTDTGHRLRVTDGPGTARPVLTGLGNDWGTRSSAWLPDGEGLLFLSPNTDCGCSVYDHVYRIVSLGDPAPHMVLTEDREVETPAVLGPPDSWTTVVTRRTTKDAALVTLQDMRQDGSDPRDLRLDVLREDPAAKTNTSDDPADDPLFHPADGYDPWTERQTYTPDGRRIAVTRFETIDGQRVQRIWLADTDGTHAAAMKLDGRGPRDRDTDPSFSPDGTRLAFTRSTPGDNGTWTSRVLVADAASGRITGRVVPPAGEVVGADAQPAWSSDGTTLAFTRAEVIRGLGGIKHVWTAPVAALEKQADLSVTGCPGECKVIDDSPAFSPDGTSIAFNRKDRADQINQRASVVVTSPKGENCRVVVPAGRRDDPTACAARIPDVESTGPYQPRDVAWSPDASRLVLSHRRDRAPSSPEQLSQLDLATGTLTPLTSELPGRQKEPAFQQQVDLTVTAPPTAPTVETGSSVTVTVTVTNHGPAPSPGTTLTADLPPGVRLEDMTTPGGPCAAGSPSCALGLLAPGAEVPVTVRLTGVTEGPWQLGWSVTGAVVDPNPTDNATGTSVQVRTTPEQPAPTPTPTPTPTPAPPPPPAPQPPAPEAGPGVVVHAQPSPGYVGGRVVVTYTVRNGKNALATGLRLRLGLPARIPVATLPPGCTGGVCAVGDLVPGASSVLRVVLAPDRALRTTITGTLTTTGTDADKGDNVSRIPLRILQPRIVSVPEIGKPGFVTSVRGKDFPPGAPVKLTWNPGITAAAAPTLPGRDGRFIAQLLIMVKDRTGPRTITASGPGFSPVKTDFLVVTGNLVPPDEMGRR